MSVYGTVPGAQWATSVRRKDGFVVLAPAAQAESAARATTPYRAATPRRPVETTCQTRPSQWSARPLRPSTSPTAQTSSAARALTARRLLAPLPLLGLGLTAQAVPSQCRTRVCGTPPTVVEPTAQMSFAARALTAVRLLATPTAGAATGVQVVPFQWAIRLCVLPPLVPVAPTAQASLAATAATPASQLASPVPFGLATRRQAVPSQCRTSVRVAWPLGS